MMLHPEDMLRLDNSRRTDLAKQFRATSRRPAKVTARGLQKSHKFETMMLRLRRQLCRRFLRETEAGPT